MLEVLGMKKVLAGDPKDLRACPGIGKLKAERITQWREEFLK